MSFILLGILNAQADAAVAGDYDLLETEILASDTTSVTFTGLGSYTDYKHLQLRMTLRSNRPTFTTDAVKLRINNDTGTNYVDHFLTGNGSSVISDSHTGRTDILFDRFATTQAASNVFDPMVLDFLDAFSTSKNTTIRALTGSTDDVKEINLLSGLYISTSAVNSIDIEGFGDFLTGSRFSLYGLKAGA